MRNITLKINGCNVNYMYLPYNGEKIPFRLVPMDGTLDNLMKPAEYKPITYNENASIDGSRGILTGRRKKKRDVSIMFWMYAEDTLSLNKALEALEDFLIKGKEGGPYGVNEVIIPQIETCYRMVFNKFDKYERIGAETGKACISLNFTETNPKNRQMP